MYSEKISFWKDREFLVSNLAVILALVCFCLFPFPNSIIQQFLVIIGFFVVFPLLFIRFILKKQLREFGFSWGNIRSGLAWAVIMEGIFLSAVFLMVMLFHLDTNSIILLTIRKSFLFFLMYIVLAWLLLFCLETLFHGLLLFTWEKVSGGWSVLIQAGALFLWFLFRIKMTIPFSVWVLIGIWSLCSGWVAYRSRSVFFSFLFSGFSVILLVVLALVFSH